MEKVFYVLILIILNNDFYNNVAEIKNPNSYSVLVNKNNKLNPNYIPYDLEKINNTYSLNDKYLRKKAKIAFENMALKAKEDGLNIIAVSAYRSYEYQDKLYNNYVKEKGIEYANLASAKKGHSEHQTGLSVDVSDLSYDYDSFENTKEFIWMKNNAHKYGFILRYPKAKFHITGFKYEPWHYRYVGILNATYIYKHSLTLEEYKNIVK